MHQEWSLLLPYHAASFLALDTAQRLMQPRVDWVEDNHGSQSVFGALANQHRAIDICFVSMILSGRILLRRAHCTCEPRVARGK